MYKKMQQKKIVKIRLWGSDAPEKELKAPSVLKFHQKTRWIK